VIERLEGVTYCLWLAGQREKESGMRKMMDLKDLILSIEKGTT